MIEKLPFTQIHSGGEDMVDRVEIRPVAPYEMQHKINELVDAVNELQKNATISKMEKVEPAENVQDKYAEQRKWIGKVCRFWDDDNTNSSCGILTSIDTETFKEPQFVCNDEYDYEHCEPVKPDDDIIYKGA